MSCQIPIVLNRYDVRSIPVSSPSSTSMKCIPFDVNAVHSAYLYIQEPKKCHFHLYHRLDYLMYKVKYMQKFFKLSWINGMMNGSFMYLVYYCASGMTSSLIKNVSSRTYPFGDPIDVLWLHYSLICLSSVYRTSALRN